MENKKFWTLNEFGEEVLRDLESEGKNFSMDEYLIRNFDSYNYMWYEMFDHYKFGDNGCDYERYGCFIKEGDVVLDLGGNIGLFAHRAEMRGASKIYSFEPVTPTFNCLIKNAGPKTQIYKNGVSSKNKFEEFIIHTDFRHIGGGTSKINELNLHDNKIVHKEKVYMIGINELLEGISEKIDFFKIDIEGGEVDVLNTITNDNLMSLRCLSAEFHATNDDFEIFQFNFCERMRMLGFEQFLLYHGDGKLRTASYWKK